MAPPFAPFPPNITLDGAALALPLRQAQIFAVLRTNIDGIYMTASELSRRAGSGHNKAQAIYSIGSRLMGTRWQLDCKQRPIESFRLVTVRSGS